MRARLMEAADQPLVLDLMRRSGEAVDEECLRDLVVFVLHDGLRLAGFAAATLDRSDGTRGRCRSARLVRWSVEQDLAGGKARRVLFEAVEAWARRQDAEELTVSVPAGSSAVKGYLEAGFGRRGSWVELRKDLSGRGPVEQPVEIELHSGPRDGLLGLFALAEDSKEQLDSYIHLGRVLVAVRGREIVGHLQLIGTDDPGCVEIRNMAVHESLQGQGIGADLVEAAARLVAGEFAHTLLVATAAADIGNLRFYQRQGFRMLSIERNAFTVGTGYPHGLRIDGIELRDRVWLDRAVLRS